MITKEVRNQSPIVIREDYAEVGLIDTYDNVVAWTLISLEDIDLVKGKKLRCDKGKYAVFFGGRGPDYLHRNIVKTNLEVDHINRNGLDNRRSNLREATHSQNGANKAMKKSIRGVRKRGDKYEAYATITVDGKRMWKYLGMHNSLNKAIKVRNKFSKEHYGDFAVLNSI